MTDILVRILRLVPVVLGLMLILWPIAWVHWRRASRRYRLIEKHRAKGRIGPASLVQGADLPVQHDVLARLGIRGEAPRRLDDRILRPSPGVRLLTAGLAVAIGLSLFLPGFAPEGFDAALGGLPMPPVVPQAILVFATINAVP